MNTRDDRNKNRQSRRRHWARRSHRVLGITSLVFILLISLTGLLLNHADGLGLSKHAAGPLMLRIYGIEAAPVDSAFFAADRLFATSSGALLVDNEELAKDSADLLGVVAFKHGYVLATAEEFLLLDKEARIVERYAPETMPPVTTLGTDGERIVAIASDELFEFDAGQMSLSPTVTFAQSEISWSRPAELDAAQLDAVGLAGVSRAINWERVLLDFHSGRILPTVGRYIADITALCLLYLCISGIVLWTRRR